MLPKAVHHATMTVQRRQNYFAATRQTAPWSIWPWDLDLTWAITFTRRQQQAIHPIAMLAKPLFCCLNGREIAICSLARTVEPTRRQGSPPPSTRRSTNSRRRRRPRHGIQPDHLALCQAGALGQDSTPTCRRDFTGSTVRRRTGGRPPPYGSTGYPHDRAMPLRPAFSTVARHRPTSLSLRPAYGITDDPPRSGGGRPAWPGPACPAVCGRPAQPLQRWRSACGRRGYDAVHVVPFTLPQRRLPANDHLCACA